MNTRILISLLALGLTVGCGDKDDGSEGEVDTGGLGGDDGDGGTTDTDTDDSGDGGGTTDTGEDDTTIRATVRGTVEVEVYKVVDGEREEVDASQLSGFPFGGIFIGGYDDPEDDGRENYRGATSVPNPTFGGNDFELDITMDGNGQIHVYASLDEDGNTIIESAEPVGVWPDIVDIEDGAVIEDIKIVIVAEYDPDDGGGSGSGSGGSGSGCDLVVSGPATVGVSYEGRGLAMIADMNGVGPIHYDIFDVASDGTGAYMMTDVCPDMGSVQLLGSIDSNGNGLFDPADTSGAYVSAPDTNGNPISVGVSDLTDYELQIPIVNPTTGEEEDNSIQVVPFVRLSGNVIHGAGTFDDLDPGSKVYVAALKYRPNTSVAVSSVISNSFDYQEFDWSELSGQTQISYQLMVPGNAETYVWAYADTDLDGTLNEVGEPVGSAGNGSGYVATGSSDAVYDMVMDVP